jgi:hypothetical protein
VAAAHGEVVVVVVVVGVGVVVVVLGVLATRNRSSCKKRY